MEENNLKISLALYIGLEFSICEPCDAGQGPLGSWDINFSVPHVRFSFSFQEDRGSDNEDQKQERNEDSAGDEKTD